MNRHEHTKGDQSTDKSYKRSKTRHNAEYTDDSNNETNLINFSFLNHKHELNKVLNGIRTRDQLVHNPKDFWLFLGKYENLLKRSGQCVLPIPESFNDDQDVTPDNYNKSLFTCLQLTTPFDELLGRLSSYELSKITELKLKQFLQIVTHYLDFKQKERFTKLKKLRKTQANLPVAQFKNEIVSAVKEEQVVLIAGDTGCGKSTQVPQFLYEAGFQSIGRSINIPFNRRNYFANIHLTQTTLQ